MSRHAVDLTGLTFGTLTVLRRVDGSGTPWLCLCAACGAEKVILSGNIQRGAKSCGCLRPDIIRKLKTTHGLKNAPEYAVWRQARARCHNPKTKEFMRYGALGIVMCDEWRKEFVAFYRDMGPRPSDKHSIDRINRFGPYSKENCRWATAKEQANNRKPRGCNTKDLQCERVL